ncbi:hypothetical protein CLAFUW4_10308 [Fulvia fulva]|uniref:Ubiquitin-like domain-containing protein n=1 Tax=Passalora fulva TaxID=5499 RepID=A0A9Q8LE24_PASFU|nr:uncharacterized protein CLAFUR5_04921 [Fulvia fulva]KAK4616341.1 hypothetical protein CLAFUR4_10312 [Fulvia fulva]KAK4617292.1 hypothetical protein CLAFUR0_10310 [Fulvia fulva]UJO15831.1 hypothetical protein CLAFUR5_04921 [Fulvia fulva]WPV19007.1 hypothetical protein CLAFUW4_10308 [Fulvia fulva]WPV33867.1 hypothetical protein CLAFUW7_10308 [Fulvia fulva]
MSGNKHNTMAVNIPLAAAVPLDVIAGIKNDQTLPEIVLDAVFGSMRDEIIEAIRAIPYDIAPVRDASSTATPESKSPPGCGWINIKVQLLIDGSDLDRTAIPSVSQRLIFAGKQMSEEKWLEECGVQEGSVVYQVLALRGT